MSRNSKYAFMIVFGFEYDIYKVTFEMNAHILLL